MDKGNFSFKRRLKSFLYALNGLKILWAEEPNFRIHIVASLLVLAGSVYFDLSAVEWGLVLFAIGLVITVEIVNTAMENICDFVSPGQNDHIKKIKDLSAAAVLFSAITAAAIALMLFVPKIFPMIFQ